MVVGRLEILESCRDLASCSPARPGRRPHPGKTRESLLERLSLRDSVRSANKLYSSKFTLSRVAASLAVHCELDLTRV